MSMNSRVVLIQASLNPTLYLQVSLDLNCTIPAAPYTTRLRFCYINAAERTPLQHNKGNIHRICARYGRSHHKARYSDRKIDEGARIARCNRPRSARPYSLTAGRSKTKGAQTSCVYGYSSEKSVGFIDSITPSNHSLCIIQQGIGFQTDRLISARDKQIG